MKIRSGFVSNSSSASFIVYWKILDFDNSKFSIVEALCKIYEVPSNLYNKKAGKFRNVPIYLKEKTNLIMQLKKLTKKNKKNKNENDIFITEFITTMMNSGDDFGEHAKSFLINLVICEQCGLIDTVIDKDED